MGLYWSDSSALDSLLAALFDRVALGASVSLAVVSSLSPIESLWSTVLSTNVNTNLSNSLLPLQMHFMRLKEEKHLVLGLFCLSIILALGVGLVFIV